MSRVCCAGVSATSGETLICTLISRYARPRVSSWRTGGGRSLWLPSSSSDDTRSWKSWTEQPRLSSAVTSARSRSSVSPGSARRGFSAELAARAEARGFLVLSGSASELERDVPFAVFVDALDEYVAGLEAHRLTSLDEDIRAELDVVLPSLRAGGAKGRASREHERYRTYRAVRELLELLAEAKPLALLIDDLHWADPASAELVGTLLRRPPAAPVLVALALRPRQLPGRLSAGLARAHRAGSLTSIELGPLSRTEARVLLGEATAGADAEPAVLRERRQPLLPRAARPLRLVSRCVTPEEAPLSGSGIDVPPLVAAALSEELALLSGHVAARARGSRGRGGAIRARARGRRGQDVGRRRRSRRSTCSCSSTSSARPRCRAGTAFATLCFDGRSTSRRRVAGGSSP